MKNHMLTIKRGRFESKSKKWFFLGSRLVFMKIALKTQRIGRYMYIEKF